MVCLHFAPFPLLQPLCIRHRGNTPIRGNSVCILFISPERIGIFQLRFTALTQVSIETF